MKITKKITKRIIALMLSLTLILSMGIISFAEAGVPAPTPAPAAVQTSGEITVTGKELTDTVTVVRMFTANFGEGDKVGYTLEPAWQEFVNGQINADDDITEDKKDSTEPYDYVAGLKGDKLVQFAKAAKKAYRDNKEAFKDLVSTKKAENNSATISGLTSGYYLVLPKDADDPKEPKKGERPTDAILVNITDKKPEVDVYLKTEVPSVDKKINDGTETAKPGNTAQIGDKIDFVLTSAVPNMTGYTKYEMIFKDILSKGLTFTEGSVKVTIGEKELNLGSEFTVNKPSYSEEKKGAELIITLTDLMKIDGIKPGDKITITYSATLNENAVAKDPNTNKVHVEYSNNPDDPSSHGGIEEDTPSSETKTYTFDIAVHKFSTDKEHLAGAEFQLQDEKGNQIKVVKDKDPETGKESTTNYHVATEDEVKKAGEGFTGNIVTVEANDIVINGLKPGTYYLEEIKAPDGYNKLSKKTKIVIEATVNTETGDLEEGSPKYTVDGDDGDRLISVENKSGAYLPETGSIGTVGLTIAGVALVVCGLGFTSRKKKED